MEINNVIVGSKLNEIQKKPDEVKLVFEDMKSHKIYVLTFNGLLFETAGLILNKKVRNIQLKDRLGFRALSNLRSLDISPKDYQQLYIQMEGSSEDNKLELIGAMRNFRLSPRRKNTASAKASAKTPVTRASSKAAKKQN